MSQKLEATLHGSCGAQHGCVRPASNPPHVCVQPLGHFPATPHQGFTPFTWTAPETPHVWTVAP